MNLMAVIVLPTTSTGLPNHRTKYQTLKHDPEGGYTPAQLLRGSIAAPSTNRKRLAAAPLSLCLNV